MCSFFFFNDTATTEIYTLSLHDALPIFPKLIAASLIAKRPEQYGFEAQPLPPLVFDEITIPDATGLDVIARRSEEQTSELQSQSNLVCRLLLEKKKKTEPPAGTAHARAA